MKFKDLKLGIRQTVIISIVFVLMSAVSVYSLLRMGGLRREMELQNGTFMPKALAILKMSEAKAKYRTYALRLAMVANPESQFTYRDLLLKAQQDFDLNLDTFQRLAGTGPDAEKLNSLWRRFILLHDRVLDAPRTMEPDIRKAVVEISGRDIRTNSDSISSVLDELEARNRLESELANQAAQANYLLAVRLVGVFIFSIILLSIFLTWKLVVSVTRPIDKLMAAAEEVAQGKPTVVVQVDTNDEIGKLGRAFQRMTRAIEDNDWFKNGQNQFNRTILGHQEIEPLCRDAIGFLCVQVEAQVGAIYGFDPNVERLVLLGGFALQSQGLADKGFALGEGLVGQVARERKSRLVRGPGPSRMDLRSGTLGQLEANEIFALPLLHQNKLVGVIELAKTSRFRQREKNFLDDSTLSLAVGMSMALTAQKIKLLLAESELKTELMRQKQKELENLNLRLTEQAHALSRSETELQQQKEELEASNNELAFQTRALLESEEVLRTQQDELKATNEELEEKTRTLQAQKKLLDEKNHNLHLAWEEVTQKARQLELNSRYKSEFLANVSHELRTPLNSLLLLAKMLLDENGLTLEQAESLGIIHRSGNELLSLINDILDLSKIEAGKLELINEPLELEQFASEIRGTFRQMVVEKGLELKIILEEGLPKTVETDGKRIRQIVKNLVSNAVKFTLKGHVAVRLRPWAPTDPPLPGKPQGTEALVVEVTDTGIGIAPEKQRIIFEAFQQADGSTSRQFGGTGLGLSISRELATLLGGEIHLRSESGKGSTFTIVLPFLPAPKHDEPAPGELPKKAQTDEKLLLVAESDPLLARWLEGHCRENGYHCLNFSTGQELLASAERLQPRAILLAGRLGDMTGQETLERLHHNPKTRAIPTLLLSTEEILKNRGLSAIGFLNKPARREQLDQAFAQVEARTERPIRELLVVEDDALLSRVLVKLLGNSKVNAQVVQTGAEALEKIGSQKFDCVVLDLGLPDMTGQELLETVARLGQPMPPVIVYTGRELSAQEQQELSRQVDLVILKSGRSQERLLDETRLFLEGLDRPPAAPLAQPEASPDWPGKRVLVVDDDARNVFALAKALQKLGLEVATANNGLAALERLEQHPPFDWMLLDIMMPIMDGYQTLRRLRADARFQKLPVIALTAKAMKEDRQKCLDAGADEYLPKPIDIKRLLELMAQLLPKP